MPAKPNANSTKDLIESARNLTGGRRNHIFEEVLVNFFEPRRPSRRRTHRNLPTPTLPGGAAQWGRAHPRTQPQRAVNGPPAVNAPVVNAPQVPPPVAPQVAPPPPAANAPQDRPTNPPHPQ